MGGTSATTSRRQALGRFGEDLACRYLAGLGYEILARNWRCPVGEIDIVAVDDGCLVVCEVKTRTSTAFGPPEEAVTWRKARRLRTLSRHWLAEQAERGGAANFTAIRVDVVAVSVPRRGAAVVNHLPGVC